MRKTSYTIIGICAALVVFGQPNNSNYKLIEDTKINISIVFHVVKSRFLLDNIDLNLDSCRLYLFNINSYSKAE